MRTTHKGKYASVSYNDDPETHKKVFDAVIAFLAKHDSWCGESIMQCDNPQIEAPELVAKIADRILQTEYDGGE